MILHDLSRDQQAVSRRLRCYLSGNRRAIYDVTFGRAPARGVRHRECASETVACVVTGRWQIPGLRFVAVPTADELPRFCGPQHVLLDDIPRDLGGRETMSFGGPVAVAGKMQRRRCRRRLSEGG